MAIISSTIITILNIPPSPFLTLGDLCIGAGSYIIGSQLLDPYMPSFAREPEPIKTERLQWEES